MPGGWCPECEAEGTNPQHSAKTILCDKHYRRALRATGTGDRREKSEQRQGWCEDCQAEGQDPAHSFKTYLCRKHHQRRYKERLRAEGKLPPRTSGKKGWCDDCEAEGVDPWHPGSSALCGKHYMRRWRAANPERYEDHKRDEADRYRERRKSPVERICLQCVEEGVEDPTHHGERKLCDRHYRQQRRRKLLGTAGVQRKPRRRRKQVRAGTSALERALDEAKEKEVE